MRGSAAAPKRALLATNPGVYPIRFHAGSLGDGLPQRDLLVFSKHAMFLDGVLVPAECLMNGTTIVRERVEQVHYHRQRGMQERLRVEPPRLSAPTTRLTCPGGHRPSSTITTWPAFKAPAGGSLVRRLPPAVQAARPRTRLDSKAVVAFMVISLFCATCHPTASSSDRPAVSAPRSPASRSA